MPRGAEPKTYDPELVGSVRELYASGQTQAEVAAALGLSQKVIWNVMRRHDIKARVAAKREQRGSANSSWKAEPSYTAAHRRVENVRGKPQECGECGCTDDRRYEWANLTGHYDDPADYRRMCVPCHRRYDGARCGGDA